MVAAPPGTQSPTEPRSGRDRIAQAAIALIAREGYRRVTLEQILERAGTDETEFHVHFADKEDCYLKLHGEISSELARRVETGCATAGSWRERARVAAYEALHYLDRDPGMARFFVVEAGNAGEAAAAQRDDALQALAERVDQARGDPPARAATRATAEVVAGAIYALVRMKVASGELSGAELVPQVMYIAAMPYFGVDAAERELAIPPPESALGTRF